MATATTTTVELTSRSKMGYGWTNQPVKRFDSHGNSYLAIDQVYGPDEIGTPRQLIPVVERAIRGNSGNAWRGALFARVDGGWRRVILDEHHGSVLDVLGMLAPTRAERGQMQRDYEGTGWTVPASYTFEVTDATPEGD